MLFLVKFWTFSYREYIAKLPNDSEYRNRREIITVRGQSYLSRLPKYWPPHPLSARRVCPPPATKTGGPHGVHSTDQWAPTSTFQTSTCYTSTALYFNREWLKFRAQWLYQKLCRSTALYFNENYFFLATQECHPESRLLYLFNWFLVFEVLLTSLKSDI
jgi:hypothetical protein